MKKVLAVMAFVLGVLVPGSATAQPATEARPVNENACERTDPLWASAPPSARPGLPHDQGHVHDGEQLGCHHATGTEDPNPNP